MTTTTLTTTARPAGLLQRVAAFFKPSPKHQLIDGLVALGYGDWIANQVVERHMSGERVDYQAQADIAAVLGKVEV